MEQVYDQMVRTVKQSTQPQKSVHSRPAFVYWPLRVAATINLFRE